MRLITLVLAALLVLIQYPLWFGKGGWFRVWELDSKLATQNKINEGLRDRNARLEGEVRDLREGKGAIEERARYELGMVKEGEVCVQILEAGKARRPVSPIESSSAGKAFLNSGKPDDAATATATQATHGAANTADNPTANRSANASATPGNTTH